MFRLRLLASVSVAMCAFAAAAVAGPAIPTDLTVPNTFGIQLKGDNNSAENLDAIAKLSFRYVRRGFIWAACEKQKGVYDFSAYDRLVKDCKARGFGIIGCIAFPNPLYGNNTVLNDEGREGYANFAAALAAHYKDENIMWEIWNEPNVRTFWGKHGKANTPEYAQEYVALVKVVAPAMHKANPNAIVLAGSVSGIWKDSISWMKYCFDLGVLDAGINAWSVHPYSTKNPEDFLEAYATTRKMMKDAGHGDMPLLNTERGFPLGKGEGAAGGDQSKAKDYQASHFVRQYMMDLLCDVRVTIWYEWSGKEGFSLHNHSGDELPVMDAAKVVIAQLDGYKLDKRIPLASDRDFVLRFTHPNGGVKLVAWTSPPAGGTADKAIDHDVEIPLEAASASITLTSVYGQSTPAAAADKALHLKLTPAPQYVTLGTPAK